MSDEESKSFAVENLFGGLSTRKMLFHWILALILLILGVLVYFEVVGQAHAINSVISRHRREVSELSSRLRSLEGRLWAMQQECKTAEGEALALDSVRANSSSNN